jgi:hypothetical protein
MPSAAFLQKYGYTPEQINAVPGLNEALNDIGNNPDATSGKKAQQTVLTIKSTLADPVSFVKNRMGMSIYEGAKSGNYDVVKQEIAFLQKSNVPSSEISSVISSSTQKANDILTNQANSKSLLGELAPVVAIGLAFALPSMGEAIGQGLLASGALAAGTSAAYATAIGTAMASIAVETAQGVPLEDAVKNAGVNAIVQTGSTSAATQLNEIIKNPAVTDALVSAGASAVKTAAAGGSADDFTRNIIGSVAGSATTSATGSNVAGSTVGGAVSGGVTGALSGAASALGTDAAKTKDTTTTTADATKTADATTLDPTTQSLVDAIKAEQANPTVTGPGVQVASSDPSFKVDVSGFAYTQESAPKDVQPPSGMRFLTDSEVNDNPNAKAVNYVDANGKTQSAFVSPVNEGITEPITTQTVTPTTGVTPVDLTAAPVISDTESTVLPKTDTGTTGISTTGEYTPTITTTPLNVVNTSGTSTTGGTDKAILDLISGTTTGGGPTTDAGTGSTAVDTGAGVVTTPVTDTTATDAAATKKGILDAKTKAWTTLAKSIGDSLSNPITTTKVNTTPSTTEMSTTKTKIADAKAKVDAALLGLSKPVTNITSVGTDTTTGATTGTGIGTGLTDTTTTGTTTTPDAGTGAGTGATTGLPDTTGTTTTTVGTDTGAGAGTGTGTDKAILDLISTDKTTGTGTATDTGTGTTAVDTGTSTDASTGAITDAATDTTDTTDTATEDTTTKPEDKYKPNLRIYGGTTPSTLSQSLGTGGTYSTGVATTGLTGSRGAGEIESKETGKKRKNVWNEASLRLKDALGV